MKTKTLRQRALSVFLVLCIIMGMVPTMVMAAGEEISPNPATAALQQAIDNLPAEGGTVTVPGDTILSHTLVIPSGKQITLSGAVGDDGKLPRLSAGDNFQGDELIRIQDGSGSQVTIDRLILDGSEKCRGIRLGEYGNLLLGGSVMSGEGHRLEIRNCHVSYGNHGGGLSAAQHSHVMALNVLFESNTAEAGNGTHGGAVYLLDASGQFAECTFSGNTANSGGAVYFYGGVESSILLLRGSTFSGNHSDQRGGAVLCHGYGAMVDCNLSGNNSGQYGGAVYISAFAEETGVSGKLLLQNTTVTDNEANSNGGGVFIANNGTLFLDGPNSTVDGNKVLDGAIPFSNNVFYNGFNSKIVVTSMTKKIGISTSNPKDQKLAVYSAAQVSDDLRQAADTINHRLSNSGFQWTQNETYSMAEEPEEYTNFLYDGPAWRLAILNDDSVPAEYKHLCDPKQETPSGDLVAGNMWLTLNVEGESNDPYVVFDYNLPGETLDVRTYPVGTQLNKANKSWPDHPKAGDIWTIDQANFTFLGWYTDPNAGERKDPDEKPITVDGDVVYYAHWRVSDGDGEGIPPVGQMYLVYFDQNYPGGGYTTTYKIAGEFHFPVPTDYGTKTITVSIPWAWPGKPYRTGYRFEGWFLDPEIGTPLGTSWVPERASTTLYAHWAPFNYTLKWNTNGGSKINDTEQKHDETVVPPANMPTKTGYRFTGWYLDKACTVPLTSGTLVKGPATFYAGWTEKEYLIAWDTAYAGGPIFVTGQDHNEKLQVFTEPTREGYTFNGWYTGRNGSGTKASASVTVVGDMTFYAKWTANTYTLTWDANGGEGSTVTTQHHDELIVIPDAPTRYGYSFTGWYLDEECTMPLVSGTVATKDATYYAGWVPNEYTITWDPNYTGGTTTAITQYHDEKLNILTKPIRDGYAFGGWYTEPNGGGVRAEAYGLVREDVTFYAKWVHETLDYTVTLEWDDLSDNDAVRPKEIVVSLMANDIPTGLTYTLDATDATDESGNIWSYTFEGLDVTDAVSNPITYSVAITSTVSDEYSYGIENKSATLGYILMTHTLITTDINSYVVWEDDSNNDGYRPSTVHLQLYANGEKVEDAEGRLSISGSGDTWTYTFADFQKYYTEDGNKGQEIRYTLKATPTNPGELDEYSIAYHNYTVILTHRKDTISRTVHVEWVDNNNQDGKRPASIIAQLYADNVPLQGKFVTLSDANSWKYTWSGLPKYTAEGREVVYSAQVTSTLVDYVAKSTEMTIELTYVPSSTAISAYVTWTDDQDADGLRPDLVPVELVADGVPTGDVQVLSKVNGWTMVWRNYPMYKNGDRVEYTFRVDPLPEGYTATYNGVYDTSGLSAILRHERIRQDLTGKIVWNDRDNVAGARMSRVAILLCADGTVIDEDKKVWLSEDGDWSHVFEGLPVYQDGGKEIKYSIVTASTIGDYRATTDHMAITMDLEVERISVPLQIIWDDGNDRDGQRPGYVAVKLLIDGAASKYQLTATAETGWSVSFDGMVRYGWKEDGSGGAFVYSPQVIVPDGYTASYTSPGVVVLSRAPAYKDVTATVTWKDNDDQYGVRPDKVTLALYADYLDGNGPQHTGRVEKCLAADGWQYTFTNVPAMQGGKNIIYSVQASGDISDYSAAYDLMDVYLTHKGYNPEGYKTDYTATIVWQDGHNAHQSRRYGAALTLYANGDAYQSYTLTQSDVAGTDYTWSHTFKDLPTRLNGQSVVYTVGIGEMSNYTAQINDNTITLTNVADWIILLNWGDDGNNDGKRPDSVHLDLYADAAKTGQRLALTGDATANSWRGVFERLPVWSESQVDKEIAYTWTVPTAEGILIEANGYTVNYNDYESATVAGERVYPLDIQQPSEVADVSVSVEWRDDTDRDGLRPETLEVRLMADYGNGPEDTDKTLTLEGGNEDTAWAGIFKSLPVWRGGVKVQYSIVPQALEGYHTSPVSPLAPVLIHDPAREEIICTVRWEDSTSAGGLQRFPITAELVIDDTITRYIGFLDEDNGYQQSWGVRYLFREHGKPYRYTFHPSIATEEMVPADYELTVEDREIVVRRVRYHISGTVRNELGDPIPNASVTIYDRENMALSTATADENGAYTFTVGEGNYTVRATAVVGSYLSGSTQCAVSNDDVTDLDIILSQADHDPTDYTYTLTGRVVDSNGESAPNALVDVWSVRRSQAASVRTDASGRFTVPGLSNGTYQLSVLYNYEGKDYTTTGIAATIFDADKEIPDIIIAVPTKDPEAPKPCNAHGKVTDLEGNGLEDILVTLYQGDQLYSAVVTNDKGEYSKDGLPDGDYKAIYHYAGTAMAQQEFTVNGEADLPLEDVAIDITAKPGYGTVSGVVLDSEGKPVEGAEVLIFDKNGDQVALTETDANGAYSVTLPVGEYTITIQSPVIRENGQDVPVDDDAAEKDDSGVTADSFTLTGVVTDEEGQGVQGVTVYLYGADPDDPDGAFVRLDETVTDAEGVYTFENLPAGSYVVKIAQGIGGNGGSTDIPVEVKPNPEVPDGSGVEVTTDSYTLEGVVQDDQGQPIRGATVTLLDSEGNEVGQIITEADGIYRFENLPQGVYQLSIRYPDNENLGGGDVSVEDGGHTVVAGFAITGTVRDNSGKALSKAAVVFVHSETKAEYVSITDSQGHYHVTLPSGEYQVQAVYGEYTASGTVTVSDKNLDKQDLTITIPSAKPDDDPGGNQGGNQGGSSGGSHGGGSSGGSSGGSHGGGSSSGGSSGGGSGSVPAAPKEYTLSGVVTDKDGKGVPGANVTATNTSTGKKHTTVTDKDGAYSFTLPSGSYTVTVQYGDAKAQSNVSLRKDSTANNSKLPDLGRLVKAYVKGYPDGTFQGERNITRMEVAALMARISNDYQPEKDYTLDFQDVSDDAWYAKELGFCVEAGLIQGRGNGIFDPTAPITRAEFAAIIARFLGQSNVPGSKHAYDDIAGSWAEGYINALTGLGIVQGKGEGRFDPDALISRNEAVTMINRALERDPDAAVLDGLVGNHTIGLKDLMNTQHWAYYQVLEAAFDHYHK